MTFRSRRRRLSRPLSNASGQGLTEYILIVALIAVAAISAVKLFGGKVRDLYGDAATSLEEASPGSKGSSGIPGF